MDEAAIANTIESIIRELTGKDGKSVVSGEPAASASQVSEQHGGHVCKCGKRMSLAIASALIAEVEMKAREMNMRIVAAVCDSGGNPVAVHRMDDAYIASWDIAINKAFTAVSLQMPTTKLAGLAAPNGPLYGIQFTNNGKLVIFGGGEPLYQNGKLIGGFGVSGGTLEQDTELGEFARDRFEEVVSCL